MIDGHVHLERGSYSLAWINEFVKYAVERNITELYLLEHSHRFLEFKDVFKDIAAYNEYQNSWFDQKFGLSIYDYIELIKIVRKHQFPIEIRFGLEVCYIEDAENALKEIIDVFHWDFVTGSVHWIDNWGFDHKKEFWEGKNIDQMYIRYFETMKSLIKSRLFTGLAHPDSIKCFGHYPTFDLTEIYDEIADLLNQYQMSAEQSAGLHLNYSHPELGMNRNMLDIFKQKNVRIYTASDAHRPEDVGRYIKRMNEMMI